MSLLQQVEECFSADDERVWSTYTQENKEKFGIRQQSRMD